VGTLLFVYYTATAGALPTDPAAADDRIFPFFIATALPSGYGLRGLLVAGIFAAAMSSLDSALGALSATAVTDVYRVFLRRSASERHYLFVARLAAVLFGVLLAGVALAFMKHDELLWETFRWASLIFGGMLGVFLLGVTTRARGHDTVNVLAMLSSVMLLALLKGYQDKTETVLIAWPWWIVLGTGWTYVIGVCFRNPKEPQSGTGRPHC
jgi:SSS family solute:Na+ symporter